MKLAAILQIYVTLKNTVLRDVTPYSLVDTSQHFPFHAAMKVYAASSSTHAQNKKKTVSDITSQRLYPS
jgi:hypothetical protein